MYYVSTKGGGGGSSQMLTFAYVGGGGGVKTLAYVIIFCKNFRAAREMIVKVS